jgi:hypothetical protein
MLTNPTNLDELVETRERELEEVLGTATPTGPFHAGDVRNAISKLIDAKVAVVLRNLANRLE